MTEARHPGTPGGGSGFTYEYSDSVESDTPTESTTLGWETVHTHTVVTAGEYIVQWTFELGYPQVTAHILGRARHNTTVIGNYAWEVEDIAPDSYESCAGMKKLALAVNDTITLEYNKEAGSGAKRMRRCRVLLIAA